MTWLRNYILVLHGAGTLKDGWLDWSVTFSRVIKSPRSYPHHMSPRLSIVSYWPACYSVFYYILCSSDHYLCIIFVCCNLWKKKSGLSIITPLKTLCVKEYTGFLSLLNIKDFIQTVKVIIEIAEFWSLVIIDS
jgi:hypothetical protein